MTERGKDKGDRQVRVRETSSKTGEKEDGVPVVCMKEEEKEKEKEARAKRGGKRLYFRKEKGGNKPFCTRGKKKVPTIRGDQQDTEKGPQPFPSKKVGFILRK